MSFETELKLWLSPGDVAAFRALARLARARPRQEALHTLYFDTPGLALARHGIALRVRRIGRRWVQTLKTEGEKSGGLSRRLELETPVGGPLPDFSRLPAETVDRLIRRKWRTRLVPVYETRFLRTAWNLRAPDGSRVEVALDVGEIVAGRLSEALCEVELELKSGSADALYGLAQGLAQRVLLIPFDASKAERGARLAAGKPRRPAGAALPDLAGDTPACAGFVQIARTCLAQLQANLPGLLQEEDPEYLHQARVALRRLRSAAGLFGKACPPPPEPMARLAELGRALGAARDWDVFVLETLPALRESVPAAQKTLLVRRAQAARRKARAAALAAAACPQTGADLIALHRWLHAQAASPGKPALHKLAARKLARLHAAALAAAEDFAGQTAAQRHALRIRIKRLRYALDYLGGLFGKHKKFGACFAGLQDELGALNDAATALGLLGQLNRDGRLDELTAQLADGLEARMQAHAPEIGRMLESFSRLAPPWR